MAPLLPNDTRGVERQDDLRVISGIVHVLRSGGRWSDPPAEYGPRKTLNDRFVRWAAKGVWQDVFQNLGVSRGGRTTEIHALSDGRGRPLAFLLTSGQAADCKAAEGLIDPLRPDILVIADRGYDTDPVWRQIGEKGPVSNIPPKVDRRWRPCFTPVLHCGRDAIEALINRLKQFRRIAHRPPGSAARRRAKR